MSGFRPLLCALVCASALALPSSALAGGWIYVESGNGTRNGNTVLALDYGNNGSLRPMQFREWPTGGTGFTLVDGKSFGTIAGDQQVTLSPDHKLLFAVNQGSNTVAVFRVNQQTGDLKQVAGSPFPSGGRAPISAGFNGRFLVVVNKGILPGEAPPGVAASTNYTSFSVSNKGRLKRISTVPAPGSGATQAAVLPGGTNVFGADFFSFQLRSFTLSSTGKLEEAAGSPSIFPASVREGRSAPPFLPAEAINLPYGVAIHPSQPLVYFNAAIANRLVIYRYSKAGSLEFVSQADNPDVIAACWTVITQDGRFLYTGNGGSRDISVFALSKNGTEARRIQLMHTPSDGNIGNIALDPTDRFLYAVAVHNDPDIPRTPPADGNFVDAFKIGSDGKLEVLASAALPVPFSASPYGMSVLAKPR